LDLTLNTFSSLQDTLSDVRANDDVRKERNGVLRKRLDGMKVEVKAQINSMLKGMGMNPEDLLSDEEIRKHLTDAFNKFDDDKSGELGQWEFKQAWSFLGLKGAEAEISQAFASVDTDNSGLISLPKFIAVIKSERMMELNLKTVLDKMGVDYDNTEKRYAAYKAEAMKRRMMKKKYEEDLSRMTKSIIETLAMVSEKEIPQKDPEQAKNYRTLEDTFNAFDKDGSGELGIEEYVEAWKFLGRGNDEEEIKASFDSVDVDGSGLIEWNEFVFSLMGEDALKFSPLADLETLHGLLQGTEELMKTLRGGISGLREDIEGRAKRNQELRERLNGMKRDMNGKLGNVMSKMLSIMGQNPEDLLTDEEISKLLSQTFTKFDVDGSNKLESSEFFKAWEFLQLKGNDEEIGRAFDSVDTDSSDFVDRDEFVAAVKNSRTAELSLSVLLTQMDGHLEGMDGFFSTYKERVEKAKNEAEAGRMSAQERYRALQKTARRRD